MQHPPSQEFKAFREINTQQRVECLLLQAAVDMYVYDLSWLNLIPHRRTTLRPHKQGLYEKGSSRANQVRKITCKSKGTLRMHTPPDIFF